MRHTISILLLTLLPATLTWGAKEQDFVALMLEQISNKPTLYSSSEYENITVSPTMIGYMLEMMDSEGEDAGLLAGDNAISQEQLRQLLKDVKSLRMFTASKNTEKYKGLMLKLLEKNKQTYKEIPNTNQDGNKGQVWFRQSNDKVVEIILIDKGQDDSKPLQILNLTGNFSDNFFETLMQIH